MHLTTIASQQTNLIIINETFIGTFRTSELDSVNEIWARNRWSGKRETDNRIKQFDYVGKKRSLCANFRRSAAELSRDPISPLLGAICCRLHWKQTDLFVRSQAIKRTNSLCATIIDAAQIIANCWWSLVAPEQPQDCLAKLVCLLASPTSLL